MTPTGVYDPGAVAPDGTEEHQLNHQVVIAADAALRSAGVDHYSEQDSGNSHDPDYRGSVAAVNAGGYALAVEVHFDDAAAPPGGFGIYYSDASPAKRLADLVAARWAAFGLPLRPSHVDNRGLWFLRGSNCPALIWECDHTARHDAATLQQMGLALAEGICDFLAINRPRPPAKEVPMDHNPPIHLEPVVSDCQCPTGGAWLLAASGAVYGTGGAPYLRAPNVDPAANFAGGNRVAVHIEAAGNGYTVVDSAGERYHYE